MGEHKTEVLSNLVQSRFAASKDIEKIMVLIKHYEIETSFKINYCLSPTSNQSETNKIFKLNSNNIKAKFEDFKIKQGRDSSVGRALD